MRRDKFECFATLLAHLAQAPCAGLDTASNALHYSKYHLHRLFSQAAGMPIQEYLRRARLTQAARLLVKTNRPILEIALDCGYESQQAFSVAFKRAYHCAPAHFRRRGQFYPLLLSIDAADMTAMHAFLTAMKEAAMQMNDKTDLTALMSAFRRAFHSEKEAAPIFRDELARELFDDAEYRRMQSYILQGKDFFAPEAEGSEEEILRRIVNGHLAPTPLCRSAFCEAALDTERRLGVLQYVLLGAGMDRFAFRNPAFLEKNRVFEVDRAEVQADKMRRIERAGWKLPEKLCFVPVDFNRDSLSEKLLSAGFSADKKSFFAWLGVSYYLDKERIGELFCALSKLCCEGSTLVFDYADQNLFSAEERRVRNMLALACAGGEPMKSCFSSGEIAKMLEQNGFLVYEELLPKQIQQRIIADRCPQMTSFEHINYIHAVKKG